MEDAHLISCRDTFVEIAKQEGVAKQTVQESVASALKKMKKYLTET